MKVKQLISILLMLLLLTACSANTDLDLPDEAGSSEQTSNMDASAVCSQTLQIHSDYCSNSLVHVNHSLRNNYIFRKR